MQPASQSDRIATTGLGAADLRAIFESVPGCYLVLRPDDPAYTIVAASEGYVQAILTEAPGLVGRGVFDTLPESWRPVAQRLRESFREVIATRTAHTMPIERRETRRPESPGEPLEERYWSPVNSPVLDDEGEVRFIIHRMDDVTGLVRLGRLEEELSRKARQLEDSQRLIRERNEVEEKLHASEARFTLAFDRAPIGMVLCTPDGRIAEINQAYVEMLGYSREELVTRDSSFFTHPDDIAPTRNFFAALQRGPHNTGSIEKRYIRKDGGVLWARASATMRRDEAGRPAQVIAITEDITERKRAEVRYRFLAESIPQMVWTATPDGMLDYVNARGAAYFGVSQEALLEDRWLQWVHPDDQELAAVVWKRSVETGAPYETAFRLRRHSDNCLRWHLVRAAPLADDKQNIVEWFGTCTDIEDQKQADANLHKQWHTFDAALSNTLDFVYTFDLEGRFTYANKALLSFWRKSLDEVLGKNFFELGYPRDLAARLQLQIQQVIATRGPVRDHTPFTDPAGNIGHYEYILAPVLGSSGKVEAVTGSTRDVTHQKRMEEALVASEEKLQQVFAQAPVAILTLRGPDFVVSLANPPYRALVHGRELVGHRFADVVPELGQHVWDAFHQVLDTGEPFVANEWLVPYDYDRDGVVENHWFNVAYNPLREIDGSVAGIIAVLTDVTKQVQARQELERVNSELEEFAYAAGHDLQEPLRMVNIYTQLLLRESVGESDFAKDCAQFVVQGVRRMDSLLRDLLTYSRTVHTENLPFGVADLSISLREARSLLEPRIEENGARITAGELPVVRADQKQMVSVFQNLLSNSLKYRRKNVPPEIHISAKANGDHWTVCIRDNGIGFDPQYAERIFGLFKRLHSDEYEGTGLGLAICKRIVERYGGRIWAEGRSGEGSAFYFTLSRVAEPVA